MTQSQNTPTLARRNLGRALKRHRVNSGLTRAEAAAKIGYSRHSIKNYEDGQGAKPLVVAGLCDAYGVDDEVKSHLCQLALKGAERGWWEKYPDGRLHLQPLYLEAEHAATDIRAIETEFIPGLLQTPGYIAELVAASHMPGQLAKDIRTLRSHRQKLMFDRRQLPKIQFAIGAGAFVYLDRMPMGIKDEQLKRILEVSEFPNVDIRAIEGVGPTVGAYTVVTSETDDGERETIVYVDGLDGCRYIEDPEVIASYEQPFAVVFHGATPIREYIA